MERSARGRRDARAVRALKLTRRTAPAAAVRASLVRAANRIAAPAMCRVRSDTLAAAREQATTADALPAGAHLSYRARVAARPTVARIGGDARARTGAHHLACATGDAHAPGAGRHSANLAGAPQRSHQRDGRKALQQRSASDREHASSEPGGESLQTRRALVADVEEDPSARQRRPSFLAPAIARSVRASRARLWRRSLRPRRRSERGTRSRSRRSRRRSNAPLETTGQC